MQQNGIFYKAAQIHCDIFNICVDIVRQNWVHWRILAKTQHRENDGQRPEFIKNRPAASVLKCIFITVLGWYQWQYMRHLEENIPKYQPM